MRVYLLALASLLLAPESAWSTEPESVGQASERTTRFAATVGAHYQQLVVTDSDPATDMAMLYTVEASILAPEPGWAIAVQGGVSERFVAQSEESGWRLQDSAIAARYRHQIQPFGESVQLVHRVRTWLPTSRYSLNQGLRLAPEVGTSGTWNIKPWLSLSMGAFGQYRWYAYAEQAGRGAGMNTQWATGARVGMSSQLLDRQDWGRVALRLGLSSQWSRGYASQANYSSPVSDANHWRQGLGWQVQLRYTPKPWASILLGMQHGGQLRRNGVVNPVLAHRDQTRLESGVTFAF